MKLNFPLTILLLLMMCGATYTVAASVSFPLGGVYRAGRYMPVQINTEAEHGRLMLNATGAIRTSVGMSPGMRVTVPWLMLSQTVQDASWNDPAGAKHELTQPLHPLNDNDLLVALLGVDAKVAQSIFPESHVVPVPLETGWTPEPAAAWEELDAIIVTADSFRALQPKLEAVLLAGTTIAVVSQTVPSTRQNEWTHTGGLWILHRQPLMAHDPVNPEVYGPTYDWIRGRTPLDRARVLLLSIILSIAVVGIALWRSRWAVWVIVAVCISGAVVVFAYDQRRATMLELHLGVASAGQLDAWTWYSPINSGVGLHAFSNLSKPVFASRRQSEDLDVTLNWPEDPSQREFTFDLDQHQTLAFIDVLPAPAIESIKPEQLPDAKEFAEHLYIRTGDHLAGTAILPEYHSLTTVVIDRPHSSAAK